MGKGAMMPLEMMLLATEGMVKSGNRAGAAKAAKSASPYMGLTADQIIEALTAGRTVPELLAEVDAKLQQATRRPEGD